MKPKFSTLWENHPTISGNQTPCKTKTGAIAHENQCAIRMGISLEKSGKSTKSFKGVRCWEGHSPGHILRAQELADWIKGAGGFGQPEVFKGGKYYSALSGRQGIVFFQNYWGTNNQGDHIDLWKGGRLTSWSTWFTTAAGGGNYSKSDQVWFWPLA